MSNGKNRFDHIKSFPVVNADESWRLQKLIYDALHAAGIPIHRVDVKPDEIIVKFMDAKTKEKFLDAYAHRLEQKELIRGPFHLATEIVTLNSEKYYRKLGYTVEMQISIPTYSKSEDARQRAQSKILQLQQAADETGINIHIALKQPTPGNQHKYVINVYFPPSVNKTPFEKAYNRLNALGTTPGGPGSSTP